eukprot:1159516-Pelagomonas_calceolata.AAC.19
MSVIVPRYSVQFCMVGQWEAQNCAVSATVFEPFISVSVALVENNQEYNQQGSELKTGKRVKG